MSPLIAVALTLAAHAGDPCPIDVRIAEHTPSWRSRSDDLGALQSKGHWVGVSYRSRGGAVRLTAVGSSSPADQAGLRPGDAVRKVGDRAISTVAELNSALDSLAPGARLPVVVERDGQSRTVELGKGPADPVVMAMVQATAAADCRSGSWLQLSAAQRTAVEAGAFDEHRGFRCDDAHAALAPHFSSGDLVVVRGGRRILVTAPGWATRCVAVPALDGDKLSPDAAGAVLEQVLAPYVQDRHDNP